MRLLKSCDLGMRNHKSKTLQLFKGPNQLPNGGGTQNSKKYYKIMDYKS